MTIQPTDDSNNASGPSIRLILKPDAETFGRQAGEAFAKAAKLTTPERANAEAWDRLSDRERRFLTHMSGTTAAGLIGSKGAAPSGAGTRRGNGIDAAISAERQRADRELDRLGGSFDRLGRRGSRSIDGIARSLRSTGDGLASVDRLALRLVGTLYAMEAVGGLLRRALVDPVAASAKALAHAREETLKFENALSGMTGRLRASEIHAEIRRQIRDLPVRTAEARAAALRMASLPGLAAELSVGTPEEAASRAVRFGTIARKFGAIDPIQGEQGARAMLAELVEAPGRESWRSARLRLGVTPESASAASGIAIDELLADPAKALQAVGALSDALVPDSVIEREGRLISVQLGKLADDYENALNKIASTGAYEAVALRLGRFRGAIGDYFDSSSFERDAEAVGRAAERVAENVGDALRNMISAASGQSIGSNVGDVAGGIAGIIERMAAGTDALPHLAARLGDGLNLIANSVASASERLGTLADLMGDVTDSKAGGPVKAIADFAAHATGSWAKELSLRLDVNGREKLRLSRMAESFAELGVEGVTVGRRQIGYRAPRDYEVDPAAIPGARRETYTSPMTGQEAVAWEVPEYAPTLDLSGVTSPRLALLAEQMAAALPESRLTYDKADEAGHVRRLLDQYLPAWDERMKAALRQAAERDQPGAAEALARQRLPEVLGSFVGAEPEPPGFSALRLAASNRLARLSDDAGRLDLGPAATARDVAAAGRVMQGTLAGNVRLGDVFDEIQRQAQAFSAQVAAAREGLASLPESDPRRDKLGTYLADLDRATTANQAAAVEAIAASLEAATLAHAAQLTDALGRVPFAGTLAAAVADGGSKLARDVEAALATAGGGGRSTDRRAALGLEAQPLGTAAAMARTVDTSRLRDIQAAARLGELRPGMASGQVLEARRNRPGEREAAGEALAFLRATAIPRQRSIVDRARRDVLARPGDEGAAAESAAAAARLSELVGQAEQIERANDRLRASFVELATVAGNALTDSVGQALGDVLLGLRDIEEAAADVGAALVRAMAAMLVQQAAGNLFGGVGGLFGGGRPGVVAPSEMGFRSVPGLAEGGVVRGELMRLGLAGGESTLASVTPAVRGFSEGGIVRSPELIAVGERPGSAEAVVPLSGGRSIPVQMVGDPSRFNPLAGLPPAVGSGFSRDGAAAAGGTNIGSLAEAVTKLAARDPNIDIAVVSDAGEAAMRALSSRAGRRLIFSTVTGKLQDDSDAAAAIRR